MNFFFNSTNEKYVVNYFSIEKIFNIIKFCFNRIISQKQKEYQRMIENDENNKNFVLINDDKEEYKRNSNNINGNNIINDNDNNNNKNPLLVKLIRNKINILRPSNGVFSYSEIINNKINTIKNNNQLIVRKINKDLSLPLIFPRTNENNNNHFNDFSGVEALKANINKNIEKLINSGILLPNSNKSIFFRQNRRVYNISLYNKNKENDNKKKKGNLSKTASVKCLIDYSTKEGEDNNNNNSISINKSFASRFQRMSINNINFKRGLPLKIGGRSSSYYRK